MIIELRSLFPARGEEESSHGPEEKHEAKEGAFAEPELRSADLPQAPPSPAAPEAAGRETPGIGERSGGISGDDRILELLGRLLDAAERSAAFSERIADLTERKSSDSAPVYA